MSDTKRARELANMILPPHIGTGWRSKEVREAAERLKSLADEVERAEKFLDAALKEVDRLRTEVADLYLDKLSKRNLGSGSSPRDKC